MRWSDRASSRSRSVYDYCWIRFLFSGHCVRPASFLRPSLPSLNTVLWPFSSSNWSTGAPLDQRQRNNEKGKDNKQQQQYEKRTNLGWVGVWSGCVVSTHRVKFESALLQRVWVSVDGRWGSDRFAHNKTEKNMMVEHT